jgi:hypothetical protein
MTLGGRRHVPHTAVILSDVQIRFRSTRHLSFGDLVHSFDAAQKDAGTVKLSNPSMGRMHRLFVRWSCSMVLLDEVVEMFGLVDLDGPFHDRH